MTPQSAKSKGRRGQQLVRDAILKAFPQLTTDDVRSTSMGATGADILLSQAAKKMVPYSIEVKTKSRSQIHTYYEQAKLHDDLEPLVVVKKDRDIPLAIVSLEHFIKLISNDK